jgi:hypothetical protein
MTVVTMGNEVVPARTGRLSPATIREQALEIRELQKAALTEGVDYGRIPNTPKPTLFQPGAQWLLKWGGYGHRLVQVHIERDKDDRPYGVTYSCVVHSLADPDVVVAAADGYCGYDEPDREEHDNRNGKRIPRSPWNTVVKMAQKRALVAAALAATAASGVFTQDVEDAQGTPPPEPEPAGKEARDQFRAELNKLTPQALEVFRYGWWCSRIPGIDDEHLNVRHLELLGTMLSRLPAMTVENGSPAPAEPPSAAPPAKASRTRKVPTPVPEPVVDAEYQKTIAARLAVTERARRLPPAKVATYESKLTEAGIPVNPAARSIDDCDRAWEILDELDCPPIEEEEEDLGDEPF